MCVNKKLRPIDCVDDPRPHALAAANASAREPSNYNCDMVTIPKLSRRQGASSSNALGAEDDAPAAFDDVDAPPPQPASLQLPLLAGVALLVAAAAIVAAAVFVQLLRPSGEQQREPLLGDASCAAAAGKSLLQHHDDAPADVVV